MFSKTQIIAKLNFDMRLLQQDLAVLSSFETGDNPYDEFAGKNTWDTLSLWNATGDPTDVLVSDDEGDVIPTSLVHSTPYLYSTLKSIVNFDKVASIKVRNLKKSFVFPHRDFIESQRVNDRSRFLILLSPNQFSYFYDETIGPFKVMPGDMFFFNVSENIHAAGNPSDESRWLISIDTFDITNDDFFVPLKLQDIQPLLLAREGEFINDIKSIESDLIMKNLDVKSFVFTYVEIVLLRFPVSIKFIFSRLKSIGKNYPQLNFDVDGLYNFLFKSRRLHQRWSWG